MGEDTFWVDVCQEDKKTGVLKSEGTAIPEDSIMLKLDMEGNGMSNSNPPANPGTKISLPNQPISREIDV